jgi:HSP20 family molecular chaperone IbpA
MSRQNRLTPRDFFESPLVILRGGPVADAPRLWDFDVQDQEKELVVRAELPGFEPDEINVEVHKGTLTVKAEKKQEAETRQSFRSYSRSVSLPKGVDGEQAQATYRNGVLELHLPKVPQAQPKRIKVQAGSEVAPSTNGG